MLTQHHELVTAILRANVVKALRASELEFGELHITDQADRLADDGLGMSDGSSSRNGACIKGVKKRLRLIVRLPSHGRAEEEECRRSVRRLVLLSLCLADIICAIRYVTVFCTMRHSDRLVQYSPIRVRR